MNGVSPLWIACQDGHLPVVEYCAALAPELLEQPKASGATPFCIACHQGHLDLVKFLADHRVDMELPNHNGATPLFYAATNGHLDVIQLLLKRGVCADTVDAEGASPFHAACRQGHVAVAEALADHGVNIDAVASNGQSALEVAEAHERSSVVSWLSHIQSVPATTPKLVAALQRQAWAKISITPQTSRFLSYDLLELTSKNIPSRVSWRFAMTVVRAQPVAECRSKGSAVQTLVPSVKFNMSTAVDRPFPCPPALRGAAARAVEGQRARDQ